MFRRLLIFVVCCWAQIVVAQDIHFSNFYTNTLNMSPADAGFFSGDIRFNLAYRDQYRTVARPYQTISANFDGKYQKRYMQTIVGYGLVLNYDMTGDAHYNTAQICLPFAHHIPLARKVFYISYGLMPAVHYNTIDYSQLTFGEQFQGTQFNPDAAVTEDFEQNSRWFFNMNVGIQFTYKPRPTQTYSIGTAFYNITQPNLSFFDDEDVQLRMRCLAHARAVLALSQKFDVVPGAKLQFQGKQHEFHFGAMGIHTLQGYNVDQINYGIWFRSKNYDAIIFGLGCRYSGFDIILNYDLNISTLRTASNNHGAFEITLSYIYDKRSRSKKMEAVHCPHIL